MRVNNTIVYAQPTYVTDSKYIYIYICIYIAQMKPMI